MFIFLFVGLELMGSHW